MAVITMIFQVPHAEGAGEKGRGVGAQGHEERVAEGEQTRGAEQQVRGRAGRCCSRRTAASGWRSTRGTSRASGPSPRRLPRAGPARSRAGRAKPARGGTRAGPGEECGGTEDEHPPPRRGRWPASRPRETVAMASARRRPTMRAPAAAPRMLPSPPITTTAKASTISSMPISLAAAVAGITSAPPAVPSAMPSVKTRHVDARHVDAERLGHLAILRGGRHDAPGPRAGEKPAHEPAMVPPAAITTRL